jgi:hypothetical protein
VPDAPTHQSLLAAKVAADAVDAAEPVVEAADGAFPELETSQS